MGEVWYKTLRRQGFAIMYKEQFVHLLRPYIATHPDNIKYQVAEGDDGTILIADTTMDIPESIKRIFS